MEQLSTGKTNNYQKQTFFSHHNQRIDEFKWNRSIMFSDHLEGHEPSMHTDIKHFISNEITARDRERKCCKFTQQGFRFRPDAGRNVRLFDM